MKPSNQLIAKTAMIAAIYTAISLLFAPFTYGTVQVRISEALVMLPVISPSTIPGLVLGCALANLVGFATGANILGFADVLFGTLATLLAALLTYAFRHIRFRNIPFLSTLPPIILNALIIGLELMWVISGTLNLPAFSLQALSVGIGQFISCVCLGLPLVYWIEKQPPLVALLKK